MQKATKENPDVAEWRDLDTLVYSSFNEYREDGPERTVELENAYPTGDTFCYWVAVNGNAFALRPKVGQTCIATVEHALKATLPTDRKCTMFRETVYVTWQPKNHTLAAWQRWAKKWTKRTAE